MPLPRLIPCLDVAGGRVVKGIRFEGLRDVGDPVELGAAYSDAGADELVFLDIAATVESRAAAVQVAARVAEQVDGVLNPPGPFQRAAVDSDSQRPWQFLPVERACALCQLNGALEQPSVHVVPDEPLAELLQPAL